jgi:PAS domain-containing protein
MARRSSIERRLADALGPRLPGARAPESEALRRFRSFALSALARGGEASPALDGLRVEERRAAALVSAWLEAAEQEAASAGPGASGVRALLEPLASHFRAALRATAPVRKQSGEPRSTRRAVMAAIDRVADAFLAIDVDTGEVVDANPAAGALLGVARDALLGADAARFFAPGARRDWCVALEAMAEGGEPRRLRAALVDDQGAPIEVDATLTRYVTRGRSLALLVARPQP